MSFSDYSAARGDNTAVGDDIYIGPNMERGKVRPALQQLAADGRALYDEMIARGFGDLPAFIADGVGAVSRTVQDKARERFSALDLLGGVLNPTDDHGALLTAKIAARFGTFATTLSTTPKEIWFGDGRYTYNLVTPIIIQQNLIRLEANGAVLQCSGTNAVVADHAGTDAIVFGVEVKGFVLKGTISNDAFVIKSGSQCKVEDIRNYATIGQAIVWYTGTISSQTRNIKSDATYGTCRTVIRETVYQKTPGHYFNCIQNTHVDVLGYYCTGPGAYFEESDSFSISGDIEACQGPAVDMLNSRFGTVSVYTEVNGQGATGGALAGYSGVTDSPDDFRIRSNAATAAIISRAINNTIISSSCGGQQVLVGGLGGVLTTPNNIHIINSDANLVIANKIGGNIVIDGAGSLTNRLEAQARWIGTLTDHGTGTVNHL